jgi:hypothetical protein
MIFLEKALGDFLRVGHGVANHYMSLPLNIITKQGGPQTFNAMNREGTLRWSLIWL